MDGLPETRYAWSDDLSIAYQTVGEGDPYLVMVPGTISHVEALHEISGYTRFLDQLSAFCCAVPFDKRGYGLSDRVSSVPLLEDRLGDVTAVADAVGASRFMLWGWSEGGSIAAMYAATYPDRVDRLVIFDAFHKFTRSPDSPHGVTPENVVVDDGTDGRAMGYWCLHSSLPVR